MIIRKRSIYILILTVVVFAVVRFVYSLFYQHHQFQFARIPPHVIFPRDFKSTQDKSLFIDDSQTIHMGYRSEQPPATTTPFHRLEFSVFDSSRFTNMDLTQCRALESTSHVAINKAINMRSSLVEIVAKLLYDMKENEYLKELHPFIIPELLIQLKLGIVERFWYRFSGSAVWMEQYQVFLMISRVIYSPKGVKNQPVLSLSYAQIYDRNWNEIQGKLVVPSNNVNGGDESEVVFRDISFPSFMPIPFYHDSDHISGKYYGPEDPRLILVNRHGYEEPLIIFNAYNRKLVDTDDDDDTGISQEIKYFRSMYMCYPWKFQKGKANVEGMPSPEYDDLVYNKIVELKIKRYEKAFETQKNWTPFVSCEDKSSLNFVYRWTNLDVLSCDLDTGSCFFEYKMNKTLSATNKIGPLRGGTQLININEIVPDKSILLPNREIFVGFPRTHLKNCGCGKVMYRPNLVILVKDISGEEPYYKVSHISPSLSLDVPIIGWDDPEDLCYDLNILIPYSISNWDVTSLTRTGRKWRADDELTLTLTISDQTIHRISIRGLFQAIIDLPDNALFKTSINPQVPSMMVKDLREVGFNNDNLVCALKGSEDFCAGYGNSFYEKHPHMKDGGNKRKKGKDPTFAKYVNMLNEYLYKIVF